MKAIVLWTEHNGNLLTYYIQQEVNVKKLADVLTEVAPTEDRHIIYHQNKDGYVFDMGNGNTASIATLEKFQEKYPTVYVGSIDTIIRRIYE